MNDCVIIGSLSSVTFSSALASTAFVEERFEFSDWIMARSGNALHGMDRFGHKSVPSSSLSPLPIRSPNWVPTFSPTIHPLSTLEALNFSSEALVPCKPHPRPPRPPPPFSFFSIYEPAEGHESLLAQRERAGEEGQGRELPYMMSCVHTRREGGPKLSQICTHTL